MKQSLRKTATQLHLEYRDGERGGRLAGHHMSLIQDGAVLTIVFDLAANFQARDKASAAYLEAVTLEHNHRRLRSLQCGDNLVRSRLIRAWEKVSDPKPRMCLELGARGRCLYSIKPHSMFTGGIQLDVVEVLEEDLRASRTLPPQQLDKPRIHP